MPILDALLRLCVGMSLCSSVLHGPAYDITVDITNDSLSTLSALASISSTGGGVGPITGDTGVGTTGSSLHSGHVVIILAGQSNMVGYNSIDYPLGVPNLYTSPQVTYLGAVTSGGFNGNDYNMVLPSVEPLEYPDGAATVSTCVSNDRCVGPAASLLFEFSRQTGYNVTGVPCAVAGTAIATWQYTPNNPYNGLIGGCLKQANYLHTTHGWPVAAVYWLQGEADYDSGVTPSEYSSQLKATIQGFRSNLTGLGPSDQIPFVSIMTHPIYALQHGGTSMSIVQAEANVVFNASYTGFLWAVDGRGDCVDWNPGEGAPLHYPPSSQRFLGTQSYRAYASALLNSPLNQTPPVVQAWVLPTAASATTNTPDLVTVVWTPTPNAATYRVSFTPASGSALTFPVSAPITINLPLTYGLGDTLPAPSLTLPVLSSGLLCNTTYQVTVTGIDLNLVLGYPMVEPVLINALCGSRTWFYPLDQTYDDALNTGFYLFLPNPTPSTTGYLSGFVQGVRPNGRVGWYYNNPRGSSNALYTKVRPTASFTASMWVWSGMQAGDSWTYSPLLSGANGPNIEPSTPGMWFLHNSDQSIDLVFDINGYTTTLGRVQPASAGGLLPSGWMMMTVTVDGNSLLATAYLNTTVVGSQTISTHWNDPKGTVAGSGQLLSFSYWQVGVSPASAETWIGGIAGVTFVDSVWSASQVQAYFVQGTTT